MAVTKQSSFMAKNQKKLQQAHEKHKDDETTYGPRELPAGIKNGIAKLDKAEIAEYKNGDLKGDFYLRLSAVVVEPKIHDGITVEGIQFSYMEPLCDTPNSSKFPTFEDHLARAYNELRKLGVNTAEIEPSELETVLKDLEAVGPYFTFNSWKGQPTTDYPNPRTNINWNGLAPDYNPDGNSSDIQDNTSSNDTDNQSNGDTDNSTDTSSDSSTEGDTEHTEETEETEEAEERGEQLNVEDIVKYKSARNPDVRQYTIVAIDNDTQTVKLKELDNPKAPVLSKVPINKLILD